MNERDKVLVQCLFEADTYYIVLYFFFSLLFQSALRLLNHLCIYMNYKLFLQTYNDIDEQKILTSDMAIPDWFSTTLLDSLTSCNKYDIDVTYQMILLMLTSEVPV